MHDLKHTHGKNQLSSLQPAFLWEMGLVLTHGNRKYDWYNWKNGNPRDYHDAILRHSLRYASGATYDAETGLHHAVFIGANAMFLHWHDEGDALPNRTCQCSCCQPPTNGHSTNTTFGG